jgi:adenylosuccinate lyase
MLEKFTEVIKNLKVNSDNMSRNMELNRGIVYSQKLLLNLMDKGIDRMKAYDMAQEVSLRVINNNSDFQKEVSQDTSIGNYLSKKEIEDIFNPYTYLKNVDKIYKRMELP